MKQQVGKLFVGVCLGLSVASVSAAIIQSTFEVDAEGWGTGKIDRNGRFSFAINPDTFDPVNYDAVGKQLQSYDIHPWNTFRSSAAYAGDKSAFFGGSISYDLYDTQHDPLIPYPNIAILGRHADMTYHMIFIQTLPPSVNSFTHYDFTLDSSIPWQKSLLVAATDADIQSVLANVVGIWINADWKTGDDLGNDDARLDNVCLRDAKSNCTTRQLLTLPGTLSLLGAGIGLLAFRRRL